MRKIIIVTKLKRLITYMLIVLASLIFIITYLAVTLAKESYVNKYQKAINSILSSDSKIAYLTFDDGPSSKETEKILDILKEENVKATFFVLGKNVKEFPKLVKREYEEGHYIASHGYSHDNENLYKNFASELFNTELEISKAIEDLDYSPHLFRFPNGYMVPLYKSQKKEALKILEAMDYAYIDWNALNKDSEVKVSNAKLLQNLKETSKNKNVLVILMHDTGDVNSTSSVLKESIEYLKSEGYEFRNMYDVFSFTTD